MIAAGKVSDKLLNRRCFCLEFLYVLFSNLIFLIRIDERSLADALEVCESRISEDRVGQNESVALTVFSNVCKSCFDSLLGALQSNFLSAENEIAGDSDTV